MKKYIEENYSCPHCHSADFVKNDIELYDDNLLIVNCECDDCGCEFEMYYDCSYNHSEYE